MRCPMPNKNMLRHITIPGVNIYEQEPGYRNVQFNYGRHYLFLPWVVYILRNDSPNPYKPGTVKTLHVGFRTEPLNISGNLQEEILLYPPFANILFKWLLVCCKPDINEFWHSEFGSSSSWPAETLLKNTNLKSYENWSRLHPKEVMTIFEQWPRSITFPFSQTGFWGGDHNTMPTQIPLGDCLTRMSVSVIEHILLQMAR